MCITVHSDKRTYNIRVRGWIERSNPNPALDIKVTVCFDSHHGRLAGGDSRFDLMRALKFLKPGGKALVVDTGTIKGPEWLPDDSIWPALRNANICVASPYYLPHSVAQYERGLSPFSFRDALWWGRSVLSEMEGRTMGPMPEDDDEEEEQGDEHEEDWDVEDYDEDWPDEAWSRRYTGREAIDMNSIRRLW